MSHILFLRFSLLITTLKLVQFQIKESSNTWIILSVSCLNGKANKSGQVIAISLLNKSVEQIPSFYFEKKKEISTIEKNDNHKSHALLSVSMLLASNGWKFFQMYLLLHLVFPSFKTHVVMIIYTSVIKFLWYYYTTCFRFFLLRNIE